jgi:hypothetical protein
MNQAYVFFGAAGNLGWAMLRQLVRTLQKRTFVMSKGE